MADDTIVTKKTAAKRAVSTARSSTPANNSATRKTAATKTVTAPADPKPPESRIPVAASATRPAARPTHPETPVAGKRKASTKPAAARSATTSEAREAVGAEERPVSVQNLALITPEERLEMIREAAYYKAERRNFAQGHEDDDWAEAEREIDDILAKARQIYGP